MLSLYTPPSPTKPNPIQPNLTQPNPTQPNPTQPNPTPPDPAQPDPTRPDPTRHDTTQHNTTQHITSQHIKTCASVQAFSRAVELEQAKWGHETPFTFLGVTCQVPNFYQNAAEGTYWQKLRAESKGWRSQDSKLNRACFQKDLNHPLVCRCDSISIPSRSMPSHPTPSHSTPTRPIPSPTPIPPRPVPPRPIPLNPGHQPNDKQPDYSRLD